MWTRKDIKEKAKIAFKGNYWISVLAGIVLTFFTVGGSSSAGRNSSESINENVSSLSNIEMSIVIGVVIAVVLAALAFEVLKILIGNALIVGADKVFIENETEQEKPNVRTIITIFKSGSWGNVVLTMFLKNLFISLWSLLFVIPGIIKTYEYMMVPFLLAENPAMSRQDAFAESKRLMNGEKMNAFVLDLSFIPWCLVTLISCGFAGLFYVNPYIYQTKAELYLTLKNNK